MDNCVCNDESFTAMDLSSFVSLKTIEVGDYSCSFVSEIKMVRMKRLERVVIGKYCFKYAGANANGHFYWGIHCRIRWNRSGI